MKGIFIILACLIVSGFSDELRIYETDATHIELPGRDETLELPPSVYVKEFVKSTDGKNWLFLMYRRRNDLYSGGDYYGLLVISKKEDNSWKVRECLNATNFSEKIKNRVTYIADIDSIRNVNDVSIQIIASEKNGGVRWERWDLEKEEKLELLEKSDYFKKLTPR